MMVNNSTNINKTNNHLSPEFQITEHIEDHNMTLEIQVLAWDRHKNRKKVFAYHNIYTKKKT